MAQDSPPLQSVVIPRFYVGGEEKGDLARDVRALEVAEDISGMKRLSFTLTAVGPKENQNQEALLYMDGELLDFGKELKVSMGPSTDLVTVFDGYISGLELIALQGREPEVRVFAEDKLMELRMTRRFKTYSDASDADLVQQIANEHGLTGQADVEGPTYKEVQQWNQSDLAFLRERARRLAADVWVDDQNTLHMASRVNRRGNNVTLIQGNDLLALEARADLAHQRTKVKVGGFDAAEQDRIDEEAASSVVAAEVQDGKHGLDVLQDAFGERVSYRVREVPLKDDEARSLAKAELLRRARRFVTVRGITLGTARLTVGSVVKLERVGPVFSGDGYYVASVRHRFDPAMGFRTFFEAERAWIRSGS